MSSSILYSIQGGRNDSDDVLRIACFLEQAGARYEIVSSMVSSITLVDHQESVVIKGCMPILSYLADRFCSKNEIVAVKNWIPLCTQKKVGRKPMESVLSRLPWLSGLNPGFADVVMYSMSRSSSLVIRNRLRADWHQRASKLAPIQRAERRMLDQGLILERTISRDSSDSAKSSGLMGSRKSSREKLGVECTWSSHLLMSS